MVDGGHRDGDDDSGHDPRDHQAHEVDFRIRERIDDHRDRRRNDRPENRDRSRQRCGVFRLIAVFAHHPDHDGAGAGRVGKCRAADPREKGDRENVGVPEAAAKAPDELRREAQQDLRQRAACHQLGGQDEERHRHQSEHVDAAEQIFRQRNRREAADADRRERRAAERKGHGHADGEQHDAADEQCRDHSFTASASNSSSDRKRFCRTYGAAISSKCRIIRAKPTGIAR